MPNKPNYKHQRIERDRAKKVLKEAKLQERKEQAGLRKIAKIELAEPGDRPIRDLGEQGHGDEEPSPRGLFAVSRDTDQGGLQ